MIMWGMCICMRGGIYVYVGSVYEGYVYGYKGVCMCMWDMCMGMRGMYGNEGYVWV